MRSGGRSGGKCCCRSGSSRSSSWRGRSKGAKGDDVCMLEKKLGSNYRDAAVVGSFRRQLVRVLHSNRSSPIISLSFLDEPKAQYPFTPPASYMHMHPRKPCQTRHAQQRIIASPFSSNPLKTKPTPIFLPIPLPLAPTPALAAIAPRQRQGGRPQLQRPQPVRQRRRRHRHAPVPIPFPPL